VQLLELWGVECEGGDSGEGGSVPIAEMSMAETFVSMVMDDLTQVSLWHLCLEHEKCDINGTH